MQSVIFLEPKGTILEVIQAAKERGFYVVALYNDKNLLANAPAPYDRCLTSIDRKEEVNNWNDFSEIEKKVAIIHEKFPVAGIYFGMDVVAPLAGYLRTKYHLPTPSVKAFRNILDKHTMRILLSQNGLSNLKSLSSAEVESMTAWPFRGDAFFKPVNGSFSIGVKRCRNLGEFRLARDEWKILLETLPLYIRNYFEERNDFLLEEAFEGELLSVESISSKGNLQVLGLTSRILYSKDPTVEMGSCFPYAHPLAEKIIAKVKKAHEVLGFTDGPSHVELIVDASGEIEIIDFNVRFVGADVLQSINYALGIQVQEALLDFAIGKDTVIKPTSRNISCIQYVLPPKPMVFQKMEFPILPEVKFSTVFVKAGTSVASALQIDYLGCYLTVLPTMEAALKRSNELRSEVIINGLEQGAY